MHTWHLHICTHEELLGWVFDSLDDSEASSRVFLFDDMLSLVVPTATMIDIKEDDISRNL